MGRDRKPRERSSTYITPEGARTLRDELDHLWKVERPRVTQEVSDAAALGDRSENAEYIYGKRRLREIDRRLRWVSKRIESLTVVEPQARDDGKVFFGCWVTVESEDGDETEYRLVGPDEADAKANLVSIDSPIGRALLGKRDGDEVTLTRPKGATTLTIVKVRYR